MTTKNLLVELCVEELPPKALKKLSEAFADSLYKALQASEFLEDSAQLTPYASPRRLAAHITSVRSESPAKARKVKLMPVAVGFTADGAPTPALIKKLQTLGYGADADFLAIVRERVTQERDGKNDVLVHEDVAPGTSLLVRLESVLDEVLRKLPIPKLMSYQLEADCEWPGWSTVHFVRPVHSVVALHGDDVIGVKVLGLTAGRNTQGHRFEAAVSPVVLAHADRYAATLSKDGAVIASFAERRAEIVRQLAAAAAQVDHGVRPIEDDALLDEVTALVERPNVLVCGFEPQFLGVPQECLILTMKANQKYFPLLDAAGKLTHQFLVVSNITPQDASLVIGGNERVVRPRLADAQFFFEQDRKKTLESRIVGLAKVVYHNKLGTQGERVERVRAIAQAIARQLGDAALVAQSDQAALLAKADLVTDMVGEFPELQGTMGRYYALNDGLDEVVADAIEDHYKPRFSGDALPRTMTGVVVALADKLETLVGMFGIGNLPTGDRDPFALRRHALGVIRMLVERSLPLGFRSLVNSAFEGFPPGLIGDARTDVSVFFMDRLKGYLKDLGYGSSEVEAVVNAQGMNTWGDIPARLAAVRAFAALPVSPALAAANKRVGNILKKAEVEGPVDPHVNPQLLQEKAEQDLYAALQRFVPEANAQFDAGDYTGSLQTLAVLRAPVDAFFDDVMVNAEQMDLRLNRQGLLKSLHDAMNRVADLSRLAA